MRYELVIDPDAKKRGLRPGHYIHNPKIGWKWFATKEEAERWMKKEADRRRKAARTDLSW